MLESSITLCVIMDLTPGRPPGILSRVDLRYREDRWSRLEIDASFSAGFEAGIVSVYRRRIQLIRSAIDERDFRALKSLHFEKLKGNRAGQYSMRLNDQWRLIVEFEGEAAKKTVVVIGIEDYH